MMRQKWHKSKPGINLQSAKIGFMEVSMDGVDQVTFLKLPLGDEVRFVRPTGSKLHPFPLNEAQDPLTIGQVDDSMVGQVGPIPDLVYSNRTMEGLSGCAHPIQASASLVGCKT
jgi:hypothetical protein